MKKIQIWALAIVLVFIGSCVTVNIYFPAAAAQKAADKIIEDIQGKDQKPEQQPQQMPDQKPVQGSRLLEELRGISIGPASAYAAEADLEISTPAILAIRESLKVRYQQQLKPYFESGVLGLANNGQIAVRDASALPLKEKASLNNLVNQQNKDLMSLYQEIARANKLGADTVPRLQKTFGDRWREKAQPGRWIQTDAGQWVKK